MLIEAISSNTSNRLELEVCLALLSCFLSKCLDKHTSDTLPSVILCHTEFIDRRLAIPTMTIAYKAKKTALLFSNKYPLKVDTLNEGATQNKAKSWAICISN